MKRYFLILLFGSIPFLSPAQVIIKPETAQHFLSVDDSLQVYKVRDTLQNSLISILREEHKVKDRIIETYKDDSVNYLKLIDSEKKQLKKEKWKTRGLGLITVIVIVLALL